MKTCLIAVLLVVAGCTSEQVKYATWDLQPDVLPEVGWDASQPELFDWEDYHRNAYSTREQMSRACYGVTVLQKRMDQILAAHRKRLSSNPDQLQLFDEIQNEWEKLAAMEKGFVQAGWSEGSGAKVVGPRARLHLLQNRVIRLLELQSQSLDLNE